MLADLGYPFMHACRRDTNELVTLLNEILETI